MSLLNYFFPKSASLPDTQANKNISITFWGGEEPTLIANGLIQSGAIMRQIWDKGLHSLLPKEFIPRSVLLLGLGTGSNTRLIKDRFPQAQITAVEIDPDMVDIARKYCHIDKIKNLRVIVADAYDYVLGIKKGSFDLVLVDCYDGKNFPQQLEKRRFYSQLKKHARFILINRLWHAEQIALSQRFLNRLSTHFPYTITRTRTNLLVSLI